MNMLNVKIKLLRPEAKAPTKAHGGDAGWDLYSAEDTGPIAPGVAKLISTGIAFKIPSGWYGQIKCRSGLGAKGAVVTGGVVDCAYTGEIKVIVIGSATETLSFKPGDKIAQLVFLPVPEVEFELVDALPETTRGTNGFGSTGA